MDLIEQNQFDICYKIINYNIIIITNIYYVHTEYLSHYNVGSIIGVKENIININIIILGCSKGHCFFPIDGVIHIHLYASVT